MKDILTEAHEIIHGDRERTYGSPGVNLENIAELWRVFIERKHHVALSLTVEDVAMMMVLMKVARLMHSPRHRDSLIDVAGYVGLIDRIDSYEKALQNTPLFAVPPTEEHMGHLVTHPADTNVHAVSSESPKGEST
jgi:hypothetical protein